MRLRFISEDKTSSGTSEYIIELALIGPKSKGGSRKFGAFLLPHKFMTIDWDLIDNPAYLDHLVIYDMTNEQLGVKPLQELKSFSHLIFNSLIFLDLILSNFSFLGLMLFNNNDNSLKYILLQFFGLKSKL